MGALLESGLRSVNHYAPLHYLPFIARTNALLGKPSLKAMGFSQKHLRSMSCKQDITRGFGQYSFLTIDRSPRILKSKLGGGFPHIAIVVPASAIESTRFNLCRFNVAMTRFLRRGDKKGFPASATNGRYYPGHEIPIARTSADQAAMLEEHLPKGTMIEVLIDGDLVLPRETTVECYSDDDEKLVRSVLKRLGCNWEVRREEPPGPYNRNAKHVSSVEEFIDHALRDPQWRGDGLEFDRV